MEWFIIIFVVVIIGGWMISSISNQNKAEKNFAENIQLNNMSESIIKEASVELRRTSYSPPQGKLVLTKTDLLFFGASYEIKFPIKSIRSTSCEDSYLVIINQSGEKFYFEWPPISTRNVGVGSLGGNLGTMGTISRNDNPIPREWQQLIDDIRFGKITF